MKNLNIIVLVKQVVDTIDKIEVTAEGEISKRGLSYDINEYDDYALEEALLIKEEFGGSVTVISVGEEKVERVLRDSLAKGADKGIRIWDNAIKNSDNFTLSKVISEKIRTMDYDLILAGVLAEDDGRAQVGPTIAQMLEIPHASVVTEIQFMDYKAHVHRELESGLEEILEVELPAVFTIQTGINKPRYISVSGIRQAMKEEILVLNLDDLGLKEVEVGESGSKTIVDQLYRPEGAGKEAEILNEDLDKATDSLVSILQKRGLV